MAVPLSKMKKAISVVIPYQILNNILCLWTQRRDSTDELVGLKEFPGGKIEIGESSEQAAIREVKEETGVLIKDLVFVKLFEFKNGLRINIFIFRDKYNDFTENGYEEAKNLLEGKKNIPPNNVAIIEYIIKYIQQIRVEEQDLNFS